MSIHSAVINENSPTHKECDVEQSRVIIDKLENVELQRQVVIIIVLCPPTFPVSQLHCQPPVNLSRHSVVTEKTNKHTQNVHEGVMT